MSKTNDEVMDVEVNETEPSIMRNLTEKTAVRQITDMSVFDTSQRAIIFIDGAHFYTVHRSLNADIDYKRMLKFWQDLVSLVQARFYHAMINSEEHNPLRKLIDWMSYNGYNVNLSQAHEFNDANGARRVIGNNDIQMVVDVMTLISVTRPVDHIILFAGKEDFVPMVKAIQNRGIIVSVVSSLQTNRNINDALRRQADNFIELADIIDNFKRNA